MNINMGGKVIFKNSTACVVLHSHWELHVIQGIYKECLLVLSERKEKGVKLGKDILMQYDWSSCGSIFVRGIEIRCTIS